MGTGAKLALLTAAVGAAVVLLVVLRPEVEENDAETTSPAARAATTTDDGTTEQTTARTTTQAEDVVQAEIVVRGGEVAGPARIELERGQRLVLVVRADAVERVHVHGYDLLRDIGPGRPARFSFRARATGRFEVELEEQHVSLTELVVSP